MVDVCLHFRLNCNCVICYGGFFLLCVYMTSTIHSRVAHMYLYMYMYMYMYMCVSGLLVIHHMLLPYHKWF